MRIGTKICQSSSFGVKLQGRAEVMAITVTEKKYRF